MKKLILFFSFLLTIANIYAQPANDACAGAQSVNPNGTCYAGTTVGAADNWVGTVGCQSANHVEVWYSFVATNSQLNVTVTEGTMTGNVEFVLVSSTSACSGLTVAGSLCGASVLTGTVNGLQAGTTYYYTISSSGSTGTFTTCVNNVAPVPVAGQDCNNGAILCDKSTFTQAASNAGFGVQEVTTTNSCWGSGGERQSKWFKFSVGCSGTLEFSIKPTVLTNDYDWAIWDITTDPTGCTTKGNSIACNWSGCSGSTGLTSCNPITTEPGSQNCTGPGDVCQSGSSPRAWYNWSAGNTGCLGTTLTVTCGHYYALLVDNYTTSNNGFTLTWGGACNGGTAIIGPDASFSMTGSNCGQSITCTKTCCTSANFTYLWNFGDGTTSTSSGPVTHTYSTTGSYIVSLTVTDQLGCSKTTSQTIAGSAITSTITATNILCNGSTTGSATVTPTNGTATYSYTWSPTGGNASSASGLGAGTYTVNVVDANGCSGTNTVSITQPPALTATQSQLNLNCNSVCNGTASVSASGGTGAYTYTWSPSGGSGSSASSLCAGNYSVTIKDANNCTIVKTFTLTQPSAIATVMSQTSTCAGTCNGSASAATSGGTPGYTYTWSPSGGNGSTASSLCSGNYTVTVKDNNNCVATASIAVAPLPNPTVTVNSSTVCPGASTTLTANGATTYSWTPATGLSATTGTSVVANPTVTTTYTITGVSGSCSGTTTSTVTIANSLTVTATSAAICSGFSGSISATGASTYSWSPSTGLSSTTGGTVTASPSVTTVYTVTGSSGSCSSTSTSTVTVNTTPTVSPSASPTVICNGNSTTLSVSGASTYTWSTGSNASTLTVSPASSTVYTVTGTSSGCTNTNTVAVNVTPLPTLTVTANPATLCSGQSTMLSGSGATTFTWSSNAGSVNTSTVSVTPSSTTTYTLSGTQNGCSSSNVITVNVSATPTVSATAASTVICNGSSTTLNASGATTYTWDNGSNATSISVNPSSNTTYTLIGMTGSCSDTTTVAVNVTPLPTLTVGATPSAICQGQSATLNVSGANTFTWSANAGGSTSNTVTVTPSVNTTYTVAGTQNGCSDSTTVSVTVNATPTVSAVASQTTICNGQSTTLNASGATTYTWDNGSNATSISVTPSSTTTYTLIGSNGNGCNDTTTVIVNVAPTPTVSASAGTSAVCSGDSTTLTASGATSYSWSTGSTATTITVTPSSNTTYTVIGLNGACADTAVVTVSVTPLPSLTVTANPASICAGQTTTLSANGATTYTWSANAGGVTTNTTSVSPNTSTSYTLAGTQNGCSDSTVINVVVAAQATVGVSATQTLICSGQSTTLTGSGATNYTWVPGPLTGSTVSVNPNTNTTYTLYGDNGGCADTTFITVNVNATPTVTAAASPNAICSGQSTIITAGGATSYTWSANAGSATTNTVSVSPVTTDTYIVTGDSQGCTSTQTVVVNVTTTPTVSAIASQTTICSGTSAVLTASGATTYTWDANAGSATTSTVSVSPSTGPVVYTVTGANSNCTDTETVTVNVTATPTLNPSSAPGAICAGQTATLSVSGATSYTWMPGVNTNSTFTDTPSSTTVYTVTGDNAGCTSTQTVSVAVNPLPTLSPVSGQTVCAGAGVNAITFTTSAGATVGWVNSNTSIGLAGAGANNINGYTAPNVGSQQTGTVTATPVDGNTGCVGASQTFVITINPAPTVSNGVLDSATCGQSNGGVTNVTVSGGTTPYTMQWYSGTSPISGATTNTLTGVGMGTYSLGVIDANGCSASGASTLFTVPGTNSVSASFVPSPSSGQSPLNVSFTNLSVGASSYVWNFGNGTSAATNPNTTYTSAGVYTVTLLASNQGCYSTYTVQIVVLDATSYTMPTVFSPNGDGINDDFFIITTGMQTLHCDIFNRWGQKVYSLASPTAKWDGKLDNGNNATDGTYYYMFEATGYDGKTYKDKGWLTLVR